MKTPEISLSMEQENAVMICCDISNVIASVTGGAGTGKTLVLGHVWRELRRRRISVVLCAPTGRAAKRIEELTNIKAKTIHRLLEFPMPDDIEDNENPNEPRRRREFPLEQQVVIVDEASMLAPTLFRQLMDALPRNGVVRFFGDNNQLPPVEEGTPPFIDVLQRFPSVELSFNFRNDDDILGNALRILRGRIPLRNRRFEIVYTDAPIPTLIQFATQDFVRDDCQIITPTRRGNFGTMRVNPALQAKLNKGVEYLRLDRYDEKEALLTIRANDKFLWIKNDYKLNMFNGEMGSVESIDTEEGSLKLVIGDREVHVPPRERVYNSYAGVVVSYDPRKQLELGYAVTTHKAQGSEFDTVVYCMTRNAPFLLDRRNFYTAVTRAKKQVIIITDQRAMTYALRRHKTV